VVIVSFSPVLHPSPFPSYFVGWILYVIRGRENPTQVECGGTQDTNHSDGEEGSLEWVNNREKIVLKK
jgi:hypothetical protein